MTRDGDLAPCVGVAPELVAAWAVAVEDIAEGAETAGNLAVLEASKATHQRIPTGTVRSSGQVLSLDSAGGSGPPCSRQDSTILRVSPCAIRPGTSGVVAR